MCTVSIITRAEWSDRGAGAFRVVCNRDEQVQRADAVGPRWREIGRDARRALWPADGAAGGTWIAASDRGLVLCLLNLNPRRPRPMPTEDQLVSRGKIIPRVIDRASAWEVVRAVEAMDLDRFAPFRLLAIEGDEGACRVVEGKWTRGAFTGREHRGTAHCFVSSGLGDHRAAPRLDLFDGMVVAGGATPEAQDLFHAHTWPDRPEVSVMMTRAEARTVSVTTVEVMPRAGDLLPEVRMKYRPVMAPVPVVVGVSARAVVGTGRPS